MSVRTAPWPPGVPCWLELSTPEVPAAAALYAAALGWQPAEPAGGVPVADGGPGVLWRCGDAAAAAATPSPAGAPASWTLHVASDDVDRTAGAVVRHGGRVLREPVDVPGVSRVLLAADPQGVAFGVWQSLGRIGAEIVNEPGGLVWEDLHAVDPAAARAFYGPVFDWVFAELPAAGEGFTTFASAADPGTPLGGIGAAPEVGPTGWLAYVAVDDVDAAVAAAEAHGGTSAGASDSDFGRQALLVDAQGAALAVMETSGEGQPDRT